MRVLIILFYAALCAGLPSKKDSHNWVMIPQVDGGMRQVSIKEAELLSSLASRKEFSVEFVLFTKSNPAHGQSVSTVTGDTLRKFFKPANPTRFISHGFQGSRESPENILIREKYLAHGDYNIFVIDWSDGAETWNYLAASKNTKEAGRQVAAFIDYLSNEFGLNFQTTYLIGHSLGAHVVGTAAKQITEGKVNTIFGLDPALPLFSISEPHKRLDKGDALYVETIHTDGGVHGFDLPIGDASFYPNWGVDQPGCDDHTGSCSHARSFIYFAETLNNSAAWIAQQCKSYEEIAGKQCPVTGKHARMGGEPSNFGLGVDGEYFLTADVKG